jgi:hypothetical protein
MQNYYNSRSQPSPWQPDLSNDLDNYPTYPYYSESQGESRDSLFFPINKKDEYVKVHKYLKSHKRDPSYDPPYPIANGWENAERSFPDDLEASYYGKSEVAGNKYGVRSGYYGNSDMDSELESVINSLPLEDLQLLLKHLNKEEGKSCDLKPSHL